MNCKAPSKLLHTLTHTLQCFLPCSTRHRRHSKRAVQQRAYKTVQIWLWNKRLDSRTSHSNTLASEVYDWWDSVDGTKPAPLLIRQFGLSLVSLGWHHTAGRFHHAATSWALLRGPFRNDSPRYEPSRSGPRSPACFGECARAHAGVCFAWNDERLHCQLVSNYTCCLCVLGGGQLCAVLWRTACIFCPPCVYLCAHLSQLKVDVQIKFSTLEEVCQPCNRAAWLKAAFYCFSQSV